MKYWLNGGTAALMALATWRLRMDPVLPAVLVFIFGGMLLSVIDWKHHLLPRKWVYYTLAGVSAGLVFAALVSQDWAALLTAAIGAVVLANSFTAVYFLGTKFLGLKIIGFGDVRLAFILGALLGWYGLPVPHHRHDGRPRRGVALRPREADPNAQVHGEHGLRTTAHARHPAGDPGPRIAVPMRGGWPHADRSRGRVQADKVTAWDAAQRGEARRLRRVDRSAHDPRVLADLADSGEALLLESSTVALNRKRPCAWRPAVV